jgi:hypothetical protein
MTGSEWQVWNDKFWMAGSEWQIQNSGYRKADSEWLVRNDRFKMKDTKMTGPEGQVYNALKTIHTHDTCGPGSSTIWERSSDWLNPTFIKFIHVYFRLVLKALVIVRNIIKKWLSFFASPWKISKRLALFVPFFTFRA